MFTKQRLFNILRLFISIGLIILLITIVDTKAIFNSLRKANPYLTLTAIILVSSIVFICAWRWKLVLKSGNLSLGFFQSLRLYYINSYISSFLPGTWGGDLVRPLFLFRQYPQQKSFLFASVFFERICGLLVVIIISTIGSIWAIISYHKLYFWAIPTIFLVGIMSGLFMVNWASKSKKTYNGFLKIIQRVITNFCSNFMIFTGNFRNLMITLGLSMFSQCVWTLSYWLIFYALDVKVNLMLILFASSMSILIGALPISVAGLGLREGSIVYLLSLFGINSEKASAAVLISLIYFLINAITGGIIAAYSTRFDGSFKKIWNDFITSTKSKEENDSIDGEQNSGSSS